MAGWSILGGLYQEELTQRKQEGVDLDAFLAAHPGIPEDVATLNQWYDELMELSVSENFPYDEPSELEAIKAARPEKQPVYPIGEVDYDKFYGAWLGRCIGCALGKPTEPFMGGRGGLPSWQAVYEWFKGADAYPIKGYTPKDSTAREKYGYEAAQNMHSLRETITYMESDDDIRYTVLGHKIAEEIGKDFTTWDVGQVWLNELPLRMVCTAEHQAYINLPMAQEMLSFGATMDEALEYVRTNRNPYREWIGAQIRVDGFAYAAAGDPELAADFAYRDAALSHVKNGIYGEMFFGAAIAAAFVEDDIEAILEAGFSKIPANCRLAADIREAIAIAKGCTDELELVQKIYDRFKMYHPVHTNNNAALCAAALIFANNDFEKAITVAVLGGWDTDCNGATVGSLMGAKLGAKGIPANWKDPLHDTLNSNIFGYHPIAISECAKRSKAVREKFLLGK